jgi:hypothetical protein
MAFSYGVLAELFEEKAMDLNWEGRPTLDREVQAVTTMMSEAMAMVSVPVGE